MNLMPEQALGLASGIKDFAKTSKNTFTGISPTFLALPEVIKECGNSENLLIGAQNAHWEDSGACTGEVSASMLKELGTDFVIIGHSECRHDLGESQDLITKRARGVLNQDLKLVYCIGETLAENKASKTLDVLKSQMEFLENISKPDYLILAYEPVWAIGTGEVASIEDIKNITDYLRQSLSATFNYEVPILYGGSVKPDNYAEILALKNVNGALVGGASLKLESFRSLFEISENEP